MLPPHQELVRGVLSALEAYRQAVGLQVLRLFATEEGDWKALDDAGWTQVQRKLREKRSPLITLHEASETESRYAFFYFGKDATYASRMNEPGAMCEATFWLPTEFMDAHGPERVRKLALELASLLPWHSGYCGLSFNGDLDIPSDWHALTQYGMRHPGIDIPSPEGHSWDIGSRLGGPSWMNFLGPAVLMDLGGASGLRAHLQDPSTTVHPWEGGKAIVTLGTQPEAGDTLRGDVLPAYRELARVLEPWRYHRQWQTPSPRDQELRRWESRFLD
ncbi:DUF3396 domain-containing protein [Stigmatella sp. ncwal1]|uniref:DUF3396 domain-containing protein n=1 Tax=Stigmatella ashevillensis TaxID=2995309 RepID=A0ABT5DDY4_9BACT|nr:DUF3396 domain-containing protein [Stigmatella ashevillena]MDC0711895.1 DUF3396 domain-containing protein [Stigmatella ashevillena]